MAPRVCRGSGGPVVRVHAGGASAAGLRLTLRSDGRRRDLVTVPFEDRPAIYRHAIGRHDPVPSGRRLIGGVLLAGGGPFMLSGMLAVAMTVAAPVGSDESSLRLPVAMGVASVGLALVVVGLLMIASDPVVDQEGAGTRLAAPAELLAPPAGAGTR